MPPKIIALIPARGGSKGIPKKNIRNVAGIPLISYSIRQALNANLVDAIYVTTDSDEIARVSKAEGANIIKRPPEISGDLATSESALIHALDYIKLDEGYEPDLVVFLQCTSPIRDENDIDNAITLLQEEKGDSLLSVVHNHGFLWEHDKGKKSGVSINYDYSHRQRRQDLQPQFRENGSIYIFTPSSLIQTNNRLSGKIILYEMSPETGYEIDDHLDLHIIESILNFKQGKEV